MMKQKLNLPLGGLLLLTMLATSQFSFASEKPRFSLPLDCTGETRCLLQNLVDMDPGKGRLDPLCREATYDGHQGTDIRVVTLPEMTKGVPILAAASGIVTATRDGEPDAVVTTKAQQRAVKGRECGNGLVIDHGNIGDKKWTTQYCHMQRGSLLVRKGQQVKRGEKLGTMGLSGMTAFPHIHVTVRADNKVIDPLTSFVVGKKPVCESRPTKSLFSKKALDQLESDDTPLLGAGFSSGVVTTAQTMAGNVPPPAPGKPLVYYAWFKNLQAGDRLRLTIRDGDVVFSDGTSKALKSSKADYIMYVGKKSGGTPGRTYKATAQILRDGKAVFTSDETKLDF